MIAAARGCGFGRHRQVAQPEWQSEAEGPEQQQAKRRQQHGHGERQQRESREADATTCCRPIRRV